MNIDYNEIKEKFEPNLLQNIDKENMKKILSFLNKQNVEFIEDIVYDYLDLFLIDYQDFLIKFEKLNQKYNYELWDRVSNDMSILEEFFD